VGNRSDRGNRTGGQLTGYGIVTLDGARIAGLLGRYGLRRVAMADAWGKDGNLTVTIFEGDRFLKLLEMGFQEN
jgi:hypothetical protein